MKLSDLENWNKTQLQDGYRVLLSSIEHIKQIIFKLENQPEKDNHFIQSWKISLGHVYRKKYEYEFYLNKKIN